MKTLEINEPYSTGKQNLWIPLERGHADGKGFAWLHMGKIVFVFVSGFSYTVLFPKSKSFKKNCKAVFQFVLSCWSWLFLIPCFSGFVASSLQCLITGPVK